MPAESGILRNIVDSGYEYGSPIAILSLVVSAMTGDGIDGTEIYILLGIAILVAVLKWTSNFLDQRLGPVDPPTVKAPSPEHKP